MKKFKEVAIGLFGATLMSTLAAGFILYGLEPFDGGYGDQNFWAIIMGGMFLFGGLQIFWSIIRGKYPKI